MKTPIVIVILGLLSFNAVYAAEPFNCLKFATSVQRISGTYLDPVIVRGATGKAVDAREAAFRIIRIKTGAIRLLGNGRSDSNMCVAGGYYYTTKPWNASWENHKDISGPSEQVAPVMVQTDRVIISGIEFFNVHDGPRMNAALNNWRIEHSWGTYIRDDCIENDQMFSGVVYDSLFDGCFAGISTRAGASNTTASGHGSESNYSLVRFERVLMRLEAQPYSGNMITLGDVPFGHGNLFKLDSNRNANSRTGPERNPRFSFVDSVFYVPLRASVKSLSFPPAHLVQECRNVTIVYKGSYTFPGALPSSKFPNCFKIVTGSTGDAVWRAAVADWHARHPQVGAARKPAVPGAVSFPRKF